jgi:hypothetical protein
MPFGTNENLDPTAQAGGAPPSIFQMLATQFLPPGDMPQAPGIQRTAMPDFSQPQGQEFIDLGAGAPAAPKSNFLSSMGEMAQQLAPMLGGAMASRGANPTTQGAGAWNNTNLNNGLNRQITAPQLGTPQNFSAPNLNLSLNPAAPRPLFSFKG